MKKLTLIIVVLLGLFSWQACEYDWVEPEPSKLPPPDQKISFANDIIPVFDRGCNMSGCHSQGGFSPDLTPANAYADLFAENMIDTINPPNSILYKKMAPGGSMNSFTKKGEPELVLRWIEEGAVNDQ